MYELKQIIIVNGWKEISISKSTGICFFKKNYAGFDVILPFLCVCPKTTADREV